MSIAPSTPSSRPEHPRRHWQRALVALVCTQMLLGCTANATPPAAGMVAGTVMWPEPKPIQPPVAPPISIWPQPAQIVQVTPNFQAPSATNCARPVATREVPGQAANIGYATPKDGLRDRYEAARRETEKKSEYVDALKERRVARGDRANAEESASVGASAMADKPMPSVAAAPAASPPPAGTAGAASAIADSRTRAPIAQAMPAPPQNSFVPPMRRPNPVVTAGMVDDNADFSEYQALK